MVELRFSAVTVISSRPVSARDVGLSAPRSPATAIRRPCRPWRRLAGAAVTGGAAPTVGFYLDEVPLSPPALSQSGKVVIDPDLYDIERIEVLRGPQGTLYGSGSMGGTIKLVTAQPKLNTWEGSFQGTLSDTQGGGGNGGGNVMLNIPIGDTLALRVVGSDTYRSGWIDRVVVNPFPQDPPLPPAGGVPAGPSFRGNVLAAPVQNVIRNVNTENLYGARATLLFQPNSDFFRCRDRVLPTPGVARL